MKNKELEVFFDLGFAKVNLLNVRCSVCDYECVWEQIWYEYEYNTEYFLMEVEKL